MNNKAPKGDLMKIKRRRARERRAAKPIVAEPRSGGRHGKHAEAGGQPRPRLGVFSGGDPTLAERFEEELYKRKDD